MRNGCSLAVVGLTCFPERLPRMMDSELGRGRP